MTSYATLMYMTMSQHTCLPTDEFAKRVRIGANWMCEACGRRYICVSRAFVGDELKLTWVLVSDDYVTTHQKEDAQ